MLGIILSILLSLLMSMLPFGLKNPGKPSTFIKQSISSFLTYPEKETRTIIAKSFIIRSPDLLGSGVQDGPISQEILYIGPKTPTQ